MVSHSDYPARLALSEQDRLAAFRLRYARYIAEQGKPYPEADHQQQILSDELDHDGDIIVVESDGIICGTVRANWLDSPTTLARYHHVFELSRFSDIAPAEIAVCSRLAASPEHRHARAREKLFDVIYERGLARNTQICFVTCAPYLTRMFRKYGFREYLAPVRDPIVGTLHRMLLVLHDLDHLAQCGSPFYRIAVERELTAAKHHWLTDMFDNYKAGYAPT